MVDRIIGSSAIALKVPAIAAFAGLPEPPSNAPLSVVIDTNLWLDLLVFRDPSAERLGALFERLQIIGCAPMRAELADVISRDRFRLDTAQRAEVLRCWDQHVRLLAIAPDCGLACTDPDDRKFLDLAISHRAHWLLSRDRALLAARKPAARRFALRIGRLPDFYNWIDDRLP